MNEPQNRILAELQEQLHQYQVAYDFGDIEEPEYLRASQSIKAEIELLTGQKDV